MIRTTLALLATLGTQSALAATVIHAGFLFDTNEGELLEKQTITIEGGRVVSVDDGFLTPEGSTVIDLSAAYVSPGFMDMHVHLCLLYTSPSPRDKCRSRMPSSA